MTLRHLWWGFGILLVALAVFVCLVPGREIPSDFELNDKVSHMIGHAGLSVYFSGLVARRNWWKLFLWLVALGIGIEFAQYYLPTGREAEAKDVLANSSGTLIGLFLGWLGLERWPQWAAWVFSFGRRAS